MRISQIVAIGRNYVIGHKGKLPWYLSGDLKFFKAQTMGKPIIMGRKTYQSIGKPLVGRYNIIVSRDPSYIPETPNQTFPDGVCVRPTIAAALAEAKAYQSNVSEVMIIGGAQIYQETFARADQLYVTEVDAVPEGDAFFPAIDPRHWRETWSKSQENMAEKDTFSYKFKIYQRV